MSGKVSASIHIFSIITSVIALIGTCISLFHSFPILHYIGLYSDAPTLAILFNVCLFLFCIYSMRSNAKKEVQAKPIKKLLPTWIYSILLLCSFLSCYSVTNYAYLFILFLCYQKRCFSAKYKGTLFTIQLICFVIQSCISDLTHTSPDLPLIPSLSVLFGTEVTGASSTLTPLCVLLSIICLLLSTEEDSSNEPTLTEDTKPSDASQWFFFFLSKPVFFYGYYLLLLCWVYFYPSVASLPLVAFIFIDLLLTRSSNYCFSRQTVMDTIKAEMDDQSNTGVIELILESLYERCVILPNQYWRFITLLYTLLVQLHSFLGVSGYYYELKDVVSNRHLLFILFGNHTGGEFRKDVYMQFFLFAGMLAYYAFYSKFNAMYFLKQLYHNVLSDTVKSHHFTSMQAVYRFINHMVRLAMFLVLAYTVDLSLGVVFVLFMLDTLSTQSHMTLLGTFALIATRFLGGLYFTTIEEDNPLKMWGIRNLFNAETPYEVLSLKQYSTLIPVLLFGLTCYLHVATNYLRTVKRSVYQALLPNSSPVSLSISFLFMMVVFFFSCFTDSHTILNAFSLGVVLILNIQNVLNKKSPVLSSFFCFCEVLVTLLSYVFILDTFFFHKIQLPTYLTPLEWGHYVSEHTLEEDTYSHRVLTYLCPLVLKTFSFYLYTYCLNNQPKNQEMVAFVENDNNMSLHQPLIQQDVSPSSVQSSVISRIGKKQYTITVGIEQALYIVCMIIILRCVLYRPTLFSFVILLFLINYILSASYPWGSAAGYLVIPSCLIVFLQYFGSFPSVSSLSNTALLILRIFGICSSEEIVPITESLIFNSEEFGKQVLFNTHLLASFIMISLLCIIMNWLNTERVSACIEGILYAVKWLTNACAKDDKANMVLKELMEKEKWLMVQLATLSKPEKPAAEEAVEEFDFSHAEQEEVVDEEKKKLFNQRTKELKAVCKKRDSILKKQQRKESFLQFYNSCLTNLSQFSYFILHHLSECFICVILILMTLATGMSNIDATINLVLLYMLLSKSEALMKVMFIQRIWILLQFFWISCRPQDWIHIEVNSASSWAHYFLAKHTNSDYLYNDILIFFFAALIYTNQASVQEAELEEKDTTDSYWQSICYFVLTLIDELFLFFLIVAAIHISTLTSLVFLCFAGYFILHPRVLHDESKQVLRTMKMTVFIMIACMSLYQLPFFPDFTSNPSSLWNTVLPMLGFTKWLSDSYEGMALCLGDGITHPHTEAVPCEPYTASTAMGFYALMLFIIYLYDMIIHSKSYQRVHATLEKDSTLISERHNFFIQGLVEEYLAFKKTLLVTEQSLYEKLKSIVEKVKIVDSTAAETNATKEYIPPAVVEVNYLTACSCQFLLHFTAEAKIEDLTGVIVTNIREDSVQTSVPHEEEYYYSQTEFKSFTSEDDAGTSLVLYHKSLIPETLYSFNICCIYKDIHTTTPVCIQKIRSSALGVSSITAPLRDFEDMEGFCCRCSIHDSEDSINLLKSDLCIMEVNDVSREIILMSPKKTLTHTIPIISICNVFFVKQDVREGLVILYLNESNRPVYLVVQPTAFSEVFTCKGLYSMLYPMLPFPSKEPITHIIEKDTRSWWRCICDYFYGFVEKPSSYENTLKTLKQFIFAIAVYTCFLFLLRGDLVSFFYIVMLFCFGIVSSKTLNKTYTTFMMIAISCIILVRYLMQTPVVCQSTHNGVWSLSLHTFCDANLVADNFQPLHVFSLYKVDAHMQPPHGSSIVWDVILLILYFAYYLFTAICGLNDANYLEEVEKEITTKEMEENCKESTFFENHVHETDLMKWWNQTKLHELLSSFLHTSHRMGTSYMQPLAITQILLFLYSLFFIGHAVENTYSTYANNLINNQLQSSTVFYIVLATGMIILDKYMTLNMDLLGKYIIHCFYTVIILISLLLNNNVISFIPTVILSL